MRIGSTSATTSFIRTLPGSDQPGYSQSEIQAGCQALPTGTSVPAELKQFFAQHGAFSDDISADPQHWAEFNRELTDDFGYLTRGWLSQESAPDDPVQCIRPEAISAAGVDADEVNLSLLVGAFAFARKREEPCFYVCVPGKDKSRYHVVNVESRVCASAYEIWVSPAYRLEEFSHFLRGGG